MVKTATKSKNNKKVSIIVVTLNPGKLLPDLFTSVFKQNYKNIEIIVNDDKRTNDNTTEIIKQWKKKLKIKYIRDNKRLGQGRLAGANAASGKYLMQIDADMRVTKGLISECVKLIEKGADAVYIPEKVIGEGFWTKCKSLEKDCYVGDEETSSPRFFSKETYFSIGGHNPKLALSEDKDLDLRLKKAGKKLVWSKNLMFHNEGRITPAKTFRNKYFWSQTGFEYLEAQPKAAWKQVLMIYFRKAYFKNWKLLITHPFLATGMYILKTAELMGAVSGGIATKTGLRKPINYKTVKNHGRKKTK